jgi:hypothetical protein
LHHVLDFVGAEGENFLAFSDLVAVGHHPFGYFRVGHRLRQQRNVQRYGAQ